MINMTPKFKVGDMVRWRREIVFADGSSLTGGDVAFWGSHGYTETPDYENPSPVSEVPGFILSHKQVWYRDSDPESHGPVGTRKTIIWYEVHWGHKGTIMAAEMALEKL